MRNPSPWSRALLATTLLIATALAIAVASSRPSVSERGAELLLTESDDRDAGPSEPSTPQQSSVGDTAIIDDSPEAERRESSSSELASTDPVEDASPTDEKESEASPSTSEPPTGEQVREKNRTDPIAGIAQDDPATETSTDPPPPKKKLKEDTVKQPTEQQQRDIRIDAFRRLSREFARRAAARGKVRSKATPAAPPDNEILPPSVKMSQEHRDSCLVFVGESMLDGKLKDNAGAEYQVLQSLGERLTVIVFWTAENPYALDQFEEIPNELAPFAELGVRTVAVHVGPLPANYEELCQKSGQNVVCVTDPDEVYFRTVANGYIPRTYVLDADGEIIWMDIEYSRTTRYELRNALHYSLREENDAAEEGSE